MTFQHTRLCYTVIYRDKNGGDVAPLLQLFVILRLEDLETQVILQMILWSAMFTP